MLPTGNQLNKKPRIKKKRKYKAQWFQNAPQRKAVVYKIATMSPRKPNSAKRTFCKVRISINSRKVFAKIPGIGEHFLQAHSIVLLRGHGPKDSPGINYNLIRGKYDFNRAELFNRKNRRSKFGVKKIKVKL